MRPQQRSPWPYHATRDGFAEQLEQLSSRAVPAVVSRDLASRNSHPAGEIWIAQHRRDTLRDFVGISRDESRASLVQDFAVSSAFGCDHRPRGRRSFERHHSKRLALGRINTDRGSRIDIFKLVLMDAAAEHHAPVEAKVTRQPAQLRLFGTFADYLETSFGQPRQCFDHQLDALVLP
jgi:hypothetical protein